MNVIDKFLSMIRGEYRRRPVPEDDEEGRPIKPGAYSSDINFIRRATFSGKWAAAEYYGPGAEAAEARRRASLGISAAPARKNVSRSEKAELRRRIRDAQRELARLEKRKRK